MSKKTKIFVAEDDVFISEQLIDMLEELGYNVLDVGYDYDSSLEILKYSNPEIAILDIKMHGKDEGLKIAQYINESLKIPFIFLTSFSDEETVQKAVAQNPSAYLVKPFNKNDIFSTLELVKRTKSIDTITIKDGWKHVNLRVSDILWVQSDDKYIEIFTKDAKYVERSSIKAFLNSNKSPKLVRVHKSFVVNITHVSKFSSRYVVVNDQNIPVSRTYKDKTEISYFKFRDS